METKIEIFEYIVHKLKDWFMENNSLKGLEEFNQKNDFSVLKLIKFHFLVTAVNSGENNLLLNQFTFYAMPYGPVETTIYSKIRVNPNFNSFVVNNFKSEFFQTNYNGDWKDNELEELINKSILKLRSLDENLINADAGSLVDLTHHWNSWKKTYSEARAINLYSKEINNDLIKNDNKYLSVEIF